MDRMKYVLDFLHRQRAAVEANLEKLNLELRARALTLTDAEVALVRVNMNDGPEDYVRMFLTHTWVESMAKEDMAALQKAEDVVGEAMASDDPNAIKRFGVPVVKLKSTNAMDGEADELLITLDEMKGK